MVVEVGREVVPSVVSKGVIDKVVEEVVASVHRW